MFLDERELKKACKDYMVEKVKRTKYFSPIYNMAKEGVDEWDYNRVYNRFIVILERANKMKIL